jgi:hypothetical protein
LDNTSLCGIENRNAPLSQRRIHTKKEDTALKAVAIYLPEI